MLASRGLSAAVPWLGLFGLVMSSLLAQPVSVAAATRPVSMRRIGGFLPGVVMARSIVVVMDHHPRSTEQENWRDDGNGARSMKRLRLVAPKLLYSGSKLQ